MPPIMPPFGTSLRASFVRSQDLGGYLEMEEPVCAHWPKSFTSCGKNDRPTDSSEVCGSTTRLLFLSLVLSEEDLHEEPHTRAIFLVQRAGILCGSSRNLAGPE